MRKILSIVFCLVISSQLISAQIYSEESNSNRQGTKEEIIRNKTIELGLVLTINKLNNTTSVEMNEMKEMLNENTTPSDKIKLKSIIETTTILKKASSFLEILSLTAGKFHIISHEVVINNNQEIHYFILSL